MVRVMTERQELAAKLREAGRELDGDNTSSIRSAFCKIDLIIGTQDTGRIFEPFFNRLADLIDPTCEYLPCEYATWFNDGDEVEYEDTKLEALGTSDGACCSSCGYEMMTGGDGWFDYERKEHGNRLIPRFDYCPYCGDRVVVSKDA